MLQQQTLSWSHVVGEVEREQAAIAVQRRLAEPRPEQPPDLPVRQRRDHGVRPAAVVRAGVLLEQHVGLAVARDVRETDSEIRRARRVADERERDALPRRLEVRSAPRGLRPERQPPAHAGREVGRIEGGATAPDPLDERLRAGAAAVEVPELPEPRAARDEQREVEVVRVVRADRPLGDGQPLWRRRPHRERLLCTRRADTGAAAGAHDAEQREADGGADHARILTAAESGG